MKLAALALLASACTLDAPVADFPGASEGVQASGSVDLPRGCAAVEPPPEVMAQIDAEMKARSNLVPGPIGPVSVSFHVVRAGVGGANGDVTDQAIHAQIDVLNHAYASSGATFQLVAIDRTTNASWFNALPDSDAERAMKIALSDGGARTLNLYTTNLGAGELGHATFPWDLSKNGRFDGVVVRHTTLPGGSEPHFDLGYTAVHEVGHWMGLYHTFQGGCVKGGDSVLDTAQEASPAFGCPVGRNTCSDLPADPIHNFMDFTDDACMYEFTQGQLERAYTVMNSYR